MSSLSTLTSAAFILVSSTYAAIASEVVQGPRHRNILLITVDDLRPQLNEAYGMPMTSTPNLDQLARESLTFRQAYCQMAVCSPSRNSFMTGRRPDTTRVWNFLDHFRQEGVGANWTSMPEFFKRNGYLSYGAGKLYHPSHPPDNDFPASWTVDEHNSFYWGNGAPIGDAPQCGGYAVIKPLLETWDTGLVCQDIDDAAALDDHDIKTQPQQDQAVEYDHRVATRTIENMRRAKQMGKNFFVAAGLRRPHLAWQTPRRFWDLYEDASIEVAKHQTIGKNVTPLAYEMNELGMEFKDPSGRKYRESPNGGLPEALQRSLRRGYYASVSFLDFEVGRILDAVSRLGLENNTAVIFHSDHGWKLGEHGDWSKCTNWEVDARVPLLIRAPWIPASAGKRTMAIVELVDLFPTAVELSGLPPVPSTEGLEGASLVPIMHNASRHVKEAAFSQYPRCPEYNVTEDPAGWECIRVPKEKISRMGFSVRVADARYTQWRVWTPACVADWTESGLVAEELYDHTGDGGFSSSTFDDYEYVNLAYDPARREQKQALAAILRAQFDRGLSPASLLV